VGDLIRRRYGRQVAERLVDSLVGGINAAQTAHLSIDVAAPQLAAAARRDRSHTRALRSAPAPASPGGSVFLAPRAGTGTIVDALVEQLTAAGVHLRAGTAVTDLADVDADSVVLAAPAFASAPLVSSRAPVAAEVLAGIDYASVSVVALAYPAAAIGRALDGSGFLVPRPEGLLMTACTWVTSKWAHAAPAGTVVLKVSAGRTGDDRHLGLDDDVLVAQLRADLRRTMGIDAEPREVAVHRWPRAFPQYAPGHLDRIGAARADLAAHLPHVAIAGAAVQGVGLPACIGSGRAAARSVLG
jgi:oxygen-dependent protoporphyrinogen oxidase